MVAFVKLIQNVFFSVLKPLFREPHLGFDPPTLVDFLCLVTIADVPANYALLKSVDATHDQHLVAC